MIPREQAIAALAHARVAEELGVPQPPLLKSVPEVVEYLNDGSEADFIRFTEEVEERAEIILAATRDAHVRMAKRLGGAR